MFILDTEGTCCDFDCRPRSVTSVNCEIGAETFRTVILSIQVNYDLWMCHGPVGSISRSFGQCQGHPRKKY